MSSVLIKKIRENTGYNVITYYIILLDIYIYVYFPSSSPVCFYVSDTRFMELFTLSLSSDFWCRSF